MLKCQVCLKDIPKPKYRGTTPQKYCSARCSMRAARQRWAEAKVAEAAVGGKAGGNFKMRAPAEYK